MAKNDYKYNEGKTLVELQKYIDSTYDEHYSKNKYQATEFIIDGGHGEGFCIGNIMKYAQRYGKRVERIEMIYSRFFIILLLLCLFMIKKATLKLLMCFSIIVSTSNLIHQRCL